MTTTNDTDPGQPAEHRGDKAPRQSVRHLWGLRIGGVILAIFGWALVSLQSATPAHMLINAVAFGCVAGYGMAAGRISRRVSTNGEKKLRLGLLVHNMELENMAVRDDLTHLFNRRYFFDRLAGELETARGLQRPLSVVLVDITQLREVNETYGHRAGDNTLCRFGQLLAGLTRTGDIPARIGGDNFAIILPDTSATAAEVMVNRIQKALENANLVDEPHAPLRLTASVGTSGFPWGGDDVDTIVLQAEASLRAARHIQRHPEDTASDASTGSPGHVPDIYRKSPQATDV